MVQNIAVVGLNRTKSYEVSKMLSDELDMFFFDALELFEFDNMPRTFDQMLKEYGESYYRRKEKGIISYASEFNNCVINLEGGMAENEINFETIKQTSLVVYLAEAVNIVEEDLKNQEYETEEEKAFYIVSEDVLKNRAEKLTNNADIIVNASEGSCLKIASEVVRMIKNYYIN